MTEMLPSHVQRDEDAAVGAVWRRCQAALPAGAHLRLYAGNVVIAQATTYGATPIARTQAETARAALEALADALEARQEATKAER